MTRRRYLTAKAKAELRAVQQGRCAECDRLMEDIEWDHILPLCLGGTNDNNWQGLCRPCHVEKTRREAGMRAKADRLRKGPKKPRGRKLQSRGFSKRLRQKLDDYAAWCHGRPE